MFEDLDNTLALILDDPAAPAELRNADISFATPNRSFPPTLTQATVNLFLYDVKENLVLRDPVPIIEKVGNSFIRRLPPLRVDCSYIVTAWSNQTGPARVVEEHRLLAQALLWLSRFPTIPAIYLQGSLPTQPFPLATTVAQMDANKNAGEFWSALGISPRPAFYLTVTVAMDPAGAVEGPLVTTRLTGFGTGESGVDDTLAQIGGRVLDAGGLSIAGALVDIIDMGIRATTDTEGRYSFLRVPVGTHTLSVVAVGFQPKVQTLTVPGPQEDYEVVLTSL